MKQFYFLLLCFLVFSLPASAQMLLHHENLVETSAGSIAGVYTEPASAWGFTSTNPSTLAQSSKGNYVRTVANVSDVKSLYIIISTLGYSSATITWEQFRNEFKNKSLLTAPLELQYSVNGGATRITFYTSTDNANGTWNKVNNGTPIALPAAAMGMPEVRIYWKINYNSNNPNETAYYAVDDITILGAPETGTSTFNWASRPLDENPFVVSGATSATPYTVDGVTMRWTAALSTGVTHEITKVDDKNFKAGTKSLALIQLNATPTAGSTIQLDLNKPVEDLTFTMFDVDVATDQFIDRLNIVGYNNGTQVPLIKNKVKITSNNQLASSVVSGVAATDNASSEGDVTVTFSKAVTRVVIQYNNSSTVRNANGRQGIAIHNLSWRKEETIAPLPVELLSFKANNKNGAALLNWSTASEKDNDKFEVERSQDGRNFGKIGEVAGNGNSNRTLAYAFTDSRPTTGTNYYRLRQVDHDGTSSYSKTIAVTFAAPKAGAAIAQVYPTIATDEVTVALTAAAGTVDIIVMDAAGRTVATYKQVAEMQQALPVQQLRAGVYFVNVSNGQVRETYRFLKN